MFRIQVIKYYKLNIFYMLTKSYTTFVSSMIIFFSLDIIWYNFYRLSIINFIVLNMDPNNQSRLLTQCSSNFGDYQQRLNNFDDFDIDCTYLPQPITDHNLEYQEIRRREFQERIIFQLYTTFENLSNICYFEIQKQLQDCHYYVIQYFNMKYRKLCEILCTKVSPHITYIFLPYLETFYSQKIYLQCRQLFCKNKNTGLSIDQTSFKKQSSTNCFVSPIYKFKVNFTYQRL